MCEEERDEKRKIDRVENQFLQLECVLIFEILL